MKPRVGLTPTFAAFYGLRVGAVFIPLSAQINYLGVEQIEGIELVGEGFIPSRSIHCNPLIPDFSTILRY
jgi:hypothetical protein